MADWIVYNANLPTISLPIFKQQFKVGNYILGITDHVRQSLLNTVKNEGLFVFGYIMPRLNFHVGKNILESILDGIKSEGPVFLNNFKGNFLILTFYNENLLIINDHFGINKYFFSYHNNEIFASNKISLIKQNFNLEISRKNILKYYLFNYFIEGITIFDNCNYSTGGTYHRIGTITETGNYFFIKEFIDEREILHSKKDSIELATQLWRDLFGQYMLFFSSKRITQTLTAGMDSRLILAGFRSNNHNPSTFTFGRHDSMDVVHAKKVARKLKISHEHLYPDSSFFSNYLANAKEVIASTSGMATIYRAHRMNAYKSLQDKYDVVFYGFIGSEIIRGLYPDGLTVPKIISDYWLTGELNLTKYLPNGWFTNSESELTEIKNELLGSDILNRPDIFIFKVMIPLHFAQDIALNDSLNLDSVAPFWDIDFLNFQKNTVYFTDNNRKEDFANLGHLSRRKGPFFSAKLIKTLDKKNSTISLGKGYSPSDYLISMYYAAIRFAFYKTFFKKRYSRPNFNYTNWYKEYLIDYIRKNPILFVDIDKDNLMSIIEKINERDELSFLHITKAININLILTEL